MKGVGELIDGKYPLVVVLPDCFVGHAMQQAQVAFVLRLVQARLLKLASGAVAV
jgi:hypothetical protein